jgi:hypothetical protein
MPWNLVKSRVAKPQTVPGGPSFRVTFYLYDFRVYQDLDSNLQPWKAAGATVRLKLRTPMSDNIELTQRFRAAATKFIEAVDSAPHLETEVFLANVTHTMAELYSVALSLPAVEPETTGTDEAPFQRDKWDALRRSLGEKIGPLDTYWTVFDFTEKQEPVQGSLAGDISEIYFDLKQSLRLEETGIPKSDLLFDWRLDFRSHWGRHLLGALTAIHHRYIE